MRLLCGVIVAAVLMGVWTMYREPAPSLKRPTSMIQPREAGATHWPKRALDRARTVAAQEVAAHIDESQELDR